MIVFKYRVSGENGLRYLCMIGDMYAANIVEYHRSNNPPEEVIVAELIHAMRDGLIAKIVQGLNIMTEYDEMTIKAQMHKGVAVSVFSLGEFHNEERAEFVINEYRHDPLKLHVDSCPETIYTI